MITQEDRKPFEEIARKKGVAIYFDKPFDSKIDTKNIHLDMDMVEESIRCAIKQTSNPEQSQTKAKLERLLKTGTDPQKIEFVLGSGTYYFPEDLENIAKLSRHSAGKPLAVDCHRVCETIWYTICRCTGNAQWCRDEAREVCRIVCD